MSRLRRMPLSNVAELAFSWGDQVHRKTARKLSAYVDCDYYLQSYPDVRSAGLDPAFHYAKYGWKEGRDPSASFSTQAYLAAHPDLLKDQMNPLLHFVEVAPPPVSEEQDDAAEIDRVASELDAAYYRSRYSIPQDMDPATHYCRMGWRSGFDPSAGFSTSHYLTSNVDVRNSGVNPFWHYLVAGRVEGRSPKHQGGWRYDTLARQRPLEKMKEDWVRREAPPSLASAHGLAEKLARICCGSQALVSIGHDDYRSSSGGVQLCIALEARHAQAQGFDYISLFPWQSLPTLSADSSDPIMAIVINSELVAHARMSSLTEAFSNVEIRAPHMVIHQLMGHTVGHLIDLTKALGIRETYFWLHDNFTLCPSYALQRNDVSFCDAPKVTSTACLICLYGKERRTHQTKIRELFGSLDVHVLAPSKTALDYWTERSELNPASCKVHPHLRLRRRAVPHPVQEAKRCRIAFVGLPAPHKGWPVFQDLCALLATDDRYEFWHFSSEVVSSDMHHAPIRSSVDHPDAAAQALKAHQIDLVLHWATCRETFSFSTHEALLAGAAVITNSGSGNVASVVRRQKCGHIFPTEDALMVFAKEDGLLALAQDARDRRSQQSLSGTYSRFTLDHLPVERCVS